MIDPDQAAVEVVVAGAGRDVGVRVRTVEMRRWRRRMAMRIVAMRIVTMPRIVARPRIVAMETEPAVAACAFAVRSAGGAFAIGVGGSGGSAHTVRGAGGAFGIGVGGSSGGGGGE